MSIYLVTTQAKAERSLALNVWLRSLIHTHGDVSFSAARAHDKAVTVAPGHVTWMGVPRRPW